MVATAAPSETHAILNSKDDRNQTIFSVLVKRTYQIHSGHRLIRVPTARPFVQADQYYDDGDPEWTTVKYETDYAPFKLATDVVVVGKAFAPGGKPTPRVDVSVEMAGRKKTVRVYGDRRCIYRANASPAFTDPIPFTELQLQ